MKTDGRFLRGEAAVIHGWFSLASAVSTAFRTIRRPGTGAPWDRRYGWMGASLIRPWGLLRSEKINGPVIRIPLAGVNVYRALLATLKPPDPGLSWQVIRPNEADIRRVVGQIALIAISMSPVGDSHSPHQPRGTVARNAELYRAVNSTS